MQNAELVVTAVMCFANGGFHISTKNSNPTSAGTLVLVCGQSKNSYFLTLFEGGLLCLKNWFIYFILFWCWPLA
jgi:hypothetical protein